MAKALARAGVASRREVERLIAEGRVALNGRVLDTPAVKVAPGDLLTVDGALVGEPEPTRVWRYHKPAGLVTTHRDPKGRATVFEHLPEGLPRVISVGRLDLNSEGLLLLTNDGGLARALELPVNGVVRRYRARARGHVTQARLDTLKDGLTVEGVHYGSIDASLDKAKEGGLGANLWITLTLTEGKNREVRKVLEALGLTVNRLIRLSYGPFQLGALSSGEVEEVGPRVIREQLAAYIAPGALPSATRPTPAKLVPGTKPPAADRADAPDQRRRQPAPKSGPRGAVGTARRPTKAKPSADGGDAAKAAKQDYKPGWAKPKKRRVHAPAKPAGAASRAAKADRSGAPGPAKPPRPRSPDRPAPRGGPSGRR